jgi:hypothetical protein
MDGPRRAARRRLVAAGVRGVHVLSYPRGMGRVSRQSCRSGWCSSLSMLSERGLDLFACQSDPR